jgi:predicted metal-binding membrane protein
MADQRLVTDSRTVSRTDAVVLAATLVLAGLCWIVALRQMHGMDMGVATELGSFPFFVAAWVPMMAAMMLPGATPTLVQRTRSGGAALPFVALYLAVWTVIGIAVYAAYRPHGNVVAGVIVIAAGLYEFTPLKSRCRRRCRETTRSSEFALCCVGSGLGLMLILLALGVMNIAWMSIITVVVLLQKLLPAKPVIDVPIALAIIGVGLLVAIAPASVPGLIPSM